MDAWRVLRQFNNDYMSILLLRMLYKLPFNVQLSTMSGNLLSKCIDSSHFSVKVDKSRAGEGLRNDWQRIKVRLR